MGSMAASLRAKGKKLHAHGISLGIIAGTLGHGGYFHGGRCRITGKDQYAGKFVDGGGFLGVAGPGLRFTASQHHPVQGYDMDTSQAESVTAMHADLKRCGSCGRLQSIDDDQPCQRCGAVVLSRRPMSVQRVWAFLIVGMIAYVPAMLMPVMGTTSYMGNREDTIMSGVFELIAAGSNLVAAIVFIASICIPVAKFLIIGMLALSLQFRWDMSKHTRHRLHILTEFIGRWSMIDVFVIAVLAALIQLGAIMTITPGLGINCFAVSVVFTMLAASSLDPRLLWDTQDVRKRFDMNLTQ